jgi:DNA-binding NarL/FixJ family response regulator
MVVDDHPVVRTGIRAFLSRQSNLEVVGEAEDGETAVRRARELMPDIVLLDIDMPGMDGFATARVLETELPQVRVLVLSDLAGVEPVTQAIESGGRGYVLKGASLSNLLLAIERVGDGEVYFPLESAGIQPPQLPTRGMG